MTEEGVGSLSRGLKIAGICCFVLSFVGCLSCVGSSKTTYGPEEFYHKGGGQIGFGAKSYTTWDESTGYFAGVLVFLGIGLLIASPVVGSVGKRRVWARTLGNLSLDELRSKVSSLEREKASATAGFLGMSEEQQRAAVSKVNDTNARIAVLFELIEKKQNSSSG